MKHACNVNFFHAGMNFMSLTCNRPLRIGNAFSSNYIEYKSNGDKDKSLSIKEYLDMIRPYLSDILNDYKTQGEWKIHLTMVINFFSSKDSEETCTTYSKSDNIEVIMSSEIDESFNNFLILFYKDTNFFFDESMRQSEFVFSTVNLL